jgi:hypothetical protein
VGIFRPAPLPDTVVSEIVDTKLRWILETCEPEEVWLFGSAAVNAMTVASDIDLALVFADEHRLTSCRKRLYARPRPDTWPQDLAFFVRDDFHRRAGIGGLPMLIVQDGRRVFSRE